MRWAFWRRRPAQQPVDPRAPATWPPPDPTAGSGRGAATPGRPGARDDPDDDRRPTPAFSGASPQPGGSSLLTEGADDLSGLLSVVGDDPHVDAAGVRGDLLALVRAAGDRDRQGAAQVLARLEQRGPDEPGVASILALAALGDRLLAAAGVEPGAALPGSLAAAQVVAQGDTVAGRASALLQATAPHCSRALVRAVLRVAAGVPEQDPALGDAPPADLALVAAALLAQTVRDGQGDAAALAEELEDLLPG